MERKNWVLIDSDSDSAVSKGKYLGVKYYAHHLNHSSILMSSFRSIRHLGYEPSVIVCVRASVFFRGELSCCLRSFSQLDGKTIYYSFILYLIVSLVSPLLCAHFIMIIKTARDRVQLFGRVRYNCRNQIRMEEKTKGKQRQEKKDQLTGNWVVYWIWIMKKPSSTV